MTDIHRIRTAVKATLQRPDGTVGRPLSLRSVFVWWAVLLALGVAGMLHFGVI